MCIQNKRVDIDLLKTELPHCPERDLGPEDVLQMAILPHASTKHAQTMGMLERTHATVKTHLKAATGEFRNNWHKFLPLAVLNHNTTYHASLGCEPTRVFHGRIPHNILDYKLG